VSGETNVCACCERPIDGPGVPFHDGGVLCADCDESYQAFLGRPDVNEDGEAL